MPNTSAPGCFIPSRAGSSSSTRSGASMVIEDRLCALTIDYNGARMDDREPPIGDVRCKDLRDASDEIRLQKRLRAEAEDDVLRLHREKTAALTRALEAEALLAEAKKALDALAVRIRNIKRIQRQKLAGVR